MRTRHFLLTLLLALAIRSPVLAQSTDDSPSDFHDWTVRVGYARYGVRGDSTGSCIMYGSGFIWVGLPAWALVTLASLSVLAIAGSVWRIIHRDDNAA